MSQVPSIVRPFTILLSSAGRRVSLLRSLRVSGLASGAPGRVIACDLSWNAPAMHMADAGFLVPRCTDPAFPEAATELCAREGVDLVVPTIDTELMMWADLKPALAATGTMVAVSDPAALAVAADKRMTNAHCVSIGVPCPRQAALSTVRADPSHWSLPLIVKPARGSSSVGLHRVSTWEELDMIPGSSETIVEECAAGLEHTVDVFIDRSGVAHAPVVRRRLEVRSGEVSKAVVIKDELLASLAVRAVETLPGAYGPLNVQVFSDGKSTSVIEINARFGGGYPLTDRAGGTYGKWLVQEATSDEKLVTNVDIDHGLMMLRWDDEVFTRGTG